MKIERPLFRENIEWRRLTYGERQGKPWKYILLKDIFIECETGVTLHYDCMGRDGRIWAKILPHGIWIGKGYAWNGNTASPDKIGATWLLLGSLPHDVLFQFSGCVGFPSPVTVRFANNLYASLTPRPWRYAYRAGLALGSWALWELPPRDGERVAWHSLHEPEPV